MPPLRDPDGNSRRSSGLGGDINQELLRMAHARALRNQKRSPRVFRMKSPMKPMKRMPMTPKSPPLLKNAHPRPDHYDLPIKRTRTIWRDRA